MELFYWPIPRLDVSNPSLVAVDDSWILKGFSLFFRSRAVSYFPTLMNCATEVLSLLRDDC